MCQGNNKCCGWIHFKSVALLVLRVTVGLVFAVHGWSKLSDIGTTAQFMGSVVGFGGVFWAWFVGLVEFLGGLMLIAGVYARLAAKILVINTVVAILLVHLKAPWQMAELPLALLGGLMGLAACGAGKWRVTKAECCCGEGSMCCGKNEGKMCGCKGPCDCGEKKDEKGCGCGGACNCGTDNKHEHKV